MYTIDFFSIYFSPPPIDYVTLFIESNKKEIIDKLFVIYYTCVHMVRPGVEGLFNMGGGGWVQPQLV